MAANYFELVGNEWQIGEFPTDNSPKELERAYDLRQPRWKQIVDLIDEGDMEDFAIMIYGIVYVACDRFGTAGTKISDIGDLMNAAGHPLPREIGITAWLQRPDIHQGNATRSFTKTYYDLPNSPCHITGVTVRAIR